MTRQLRLLDPPGDEWRIDEETRRVGLAGVAAAREALRSTRPPAAVAEHPDAGPRGRLTEPVGPRRRLWA